MDTHLTLNVTQLKQLTQTQTYPLHDLNAYSDPPRNMKTEIVNNIEHTRIISDPNVTTEKCRNTFTLPSPHNTSVLEKITKLIIPL